MKLSEYIQHLTELLHSKGDVEVYKYTASGVRKATEPEAKNLRILSKRESRQDYWEKYRFACNDENKGEQVVAI